MPLKVRTDIGGVVVGPAVNTLFFSGTGGTAAQSCATAVHSFWAAIATQMAAYATLQVESVVEEVDMSGHLLFLWATTTAAIAGTTTQPQAPLQAQGLIRLHTGVIINHRESVGRVFVPGVGLDDVGAGGVATSAYKAVLDNAAAALIGAAVGWSVFSHKHSALDPVSLAKTNSKFATLNSRRD